MTNKLEEYKFKLNECKDSGTLYIILSGLDGGCDELLIRDISSYLSKNASTLNIKFLNCTDIKFDLKEFSSIIELILQKKNLNKKEIIYVGHSLSCYFIAAHLNSKGSKNICIFLDPTPIKILDNLKDHDFEEDENFYISKQEKEFKINKKLITPIKEGLVSNNIYQNKNYKIVLSSNYLDEPKKIDEKYFVSEHEIIFYKATHSFEELGNEDFKVLFR